MIPVLFLLAAWSLLFALKNWPTTKPAPKPKPRYRGYLKE